MTRVLATRAGGQYNILVVPCSYVAKNTQGQVARASNEVAKGNGESGEVRSCHAG